MLVQRQVLYLGEIGDGQHDYLGAVRSKRLTRMRNATPACRFFLPIVSSQTGRWVRRTGAARCDGVASAAAVGRVLAFV